MFTRLQQSSWPRIGRRGLVVLLMLALAFASLSAAGRHVSAQSDPDCEDPDTVACIPTTAAGGSGGSAAPAQPAAAPSSAGAAAAAPAAPPGIVPPGPICPVPPGPPLPVGPGAAAAPAPPPVSGYFPCFNDIYGTINRANLAYARAMRSLDASQLRLYWGQDALQDLLSQIGQLRATGSYRVLRLQSIQLIEQSVGPNYAWVHTSEHWIAQTWSYDGYEYDSADAWYDNQYYLYRVGERWLIGSDIVS
ncbi:MAG TPA: hypothetical protein VKV26_06250 [Dehalococcoidia bacterium]|nr:hypothetical protein [Dehalococcoidia bacterium]